MKKRQRKRTIKGRRLARTFVSTALALLLAGSGLEAAPMAKAANTASLQNPRISEVQGGELDVASGLRNPRVKMRIRDTITFGSYWQEDTNGDGVADQNDEKQPVRWQVLSVDGDDVFLLADKVLDCQPYNTKNTSVTWETCSLRKWLNEDFYNTAFSDTEKAAIKETTVTNADNPEYGTEGGTDTKDKVYLLSLSEVSDPAYGFHSMMYYDDQARIGKVTSYAKAEGVWTNGEKGSYWWLRSPGREGSLATLVDSDGPADTNGNFVDTSNYGVRPALHFNLSSSLTKVGTVTAKEGFLTGGTSGGVTYDPPGLFGEFDTEVEQPSKPSGPSEGGSTGSDQPSGPSTPSGGNSTGIPSGGSSSGTPSDSQGQGGTGSQNGIQTGQKTDTKLGKVSSLKAKNNKKKTVTLSWKKVSKAKKYQIQYSQNKKFKKAKTKTTKKVSYKITKLAKKKTYYFRVRAISAEGKKGAWSKTVKVKVKE